MIIEERRIMDKLNFFYSEKVDVHVEKKDREFLNGRLVRPLKDDKSVWLLEEFKLGEVYLFTKDIFDLDEFKEKKEDGVRGKEVNSE